MKNIKSEFTFLRLETYFYFVIVLVVAAVARFRVSWDGILYLASAKSLFNSNFYVYYHWIREPLYPFFIKVTHFILGNSDFTFSLAQSSMLGVSLVLLLMRLWPGQKISLIFIRCTIFSIVMLNPLTIGYAGSVLQQTMFAAILNLQVYVLLGAKLNYLSKRRKLTELTIVGILSINASVLLIPTYLVTVAIYASHVVQLNPQDQKKLFSMLFKYAKSVWIALTATALSLAIWYGIKAVAYAEHEIVRNQSEFWLWDKKNDFDFIEQKFKTILPLLNLSNEEQYDGFGRENMIFGLGFEKELCGIVSSEPSKQASFVENYYIQSCRSYALYPSFQKLYKFGSNLVSLTSTFGFLAMFISIFSKRFRNKFVYLIPAQVLIFTYWFLAAGISRYGFPIFSSTFCVVSSIAIRKVSKSIFQKEDNLN